MVLGEQFMGQVVDTNSKSFGITFVLLYTGNKHFSQNGVEIHQSSQPLKTKILMMAKVHNRMIRHFNKVLIAPAEGVGRAKGALAR